MKKTSEKQFLESLSKLTESLRKQIEADCTAFPVDAAASAQRRKKVQESFTFFRKTYFPHYTRKKDGTPTGDSDLHVYFDATMPKAIDAAEGQLVATAAPRGEAKSTFMNVFFPLWCYVTKRKSYILLISDALEQAATQLEALKVELESNPRLAADFAELCGEGRVWNVGTIVTVGNVKIQALGAGKRMRGLRHGPYRPDLVILDDMENDENVRKPEQRDYLERWLNRTVLPLGSADGVMDVIYIGTILHYDSVLARVLQKPHWIRKKLQAVKRFPTHMDLWEKWQNILETAPKESALQDAKDFYEKHKKKMDAGAEISWPGYKSLYKLMLTRAMDRESFDSEQQNDPLSGDGAPFADIIVLWQELPKSMHVFGACDPSMGKHGKGRDPSAILIGGLNRDNMTLYTLEADIKKRHPDRIIQDILAYQLRYRCLLFGVEAIQFQEFFADALVKEAMRQNIILPVRPIINSTDKILRIETLQPYVKRGQIQINPDHKTLLAMLRHFPKADHDDGPDALEMLWRIATQGFVSMEGAFGRVQQESWGGGVVGVKDDDDIDTWGNNGGWNA